MTAHNPETIEKVKKWLRYADDDLRSARHLMIWKNAEYNKSQCWKETSLQNP